MFSTILGTTNAVAETPCDTDSVMLTNDTDNARSPERCVNPTEPIEGAPGSGVSTPTDADNTNLQDRDEDDEDEDGDVGNNLSDGGDMSSRNTTSYYTNLFRVCKDGVYLNGETDKKQDESILFPVDEVVKKMRDGFTYSAVEYPRVDTDTDTVHDELLSCKYYTGEGGGAGGIRCNPAQFTTLMEEIVGVEESDESDDSGSESYGTTLVNVVMHNDEPVSFHSSRQDAINAMWEWARRELLRDSVDNCCHIKVGVDQSRISITARGRFTWLPLYRDIHSFYVTPVRGYLD